MSRGGTRRARAEQAALRQTRRRKERAAEPKGAKKAPKIVKKAARKKAGKGRSALVHLSGFAPPLLLALGLFSSGRVSSAIPTNRYWLDAYIDDPNASYIQEPAGFLYAAVVFVLAAAAFRVFPLWVWHKLTGDQSVLVRDRSAIDGSFTISIVILIVWVYRLFGGFSDTISGFAFLMLLLSVYVPVFSALLAFGMPIVPGSGRVGGILPGFLRVPFTARYLLSDEEKDTLERFAAIKDAGD